MGVAFPAAAVAATDVASATVTLKEGSSGVQLGLEARANLPRLWTPRVNHLLAQAEAIGRLLEAMR